MRGELRHAGGTSARATAGQEYFWRLVEGDPDPTTYACPVVLLVDGPLDVPALVTSVEATIAAHSIYRTVYRDVDGELHQFVKRASETPRFELELVDLGTVPDEERRARWRACVDRLVSRGFDYDLPRYVSGCLLALAPEQHALVLVLHHIVADAASCGAVLKEAFARYRAAIGVPGAAEPAGPRLQYLDYAEAVMRWSEAPEGGEQREFWRHEVRDARPMHVPTDFSRAAIGAQEEATAGGIVPVAMHAPTFTPALEPAARESVAALARAERTTPYAVYLGVMAALAHELTGERVVWIETVHNPRADDRRLEDIHGLIATWHVVRIEIPSPPRLADLVRTAKESLGRIKGRGVVPDYYRTVPKGLRRIVLNYLFFIDRGTMELAPGLTGTRPSVGFPPWKRPWDLHLTVMDSARECVLYWTGAEPLFRRDTVGKLLERYLALLA